MGGRGAGGARGQGGGGKEGGPHQPTRPRAHQAPTPRLPAQAPLAARRPVIEWGGGAWSGTRRGRGAAGDGDGKRGWAEGLGGLQQTNCTHTHPTPNSPMPLLRSMALRRSSNSLAGICRPTAISAGKCARRNSSTACSSSLVRQWKPFFTRPTWPHSSRTFCLDDVWRRMMRSRWRISSLRSQLGSWLALTSANHTRPCVQRGRE